jgi:CBS domain containing-hemolysin-like protein
MTRDVITVGPDSCVEQVATVMAERGFAALPVVDEDDGLVGIVAEAAVLRSGLSRRPASPARVRGVMTAGVRSVDADADVADIARIFIHEHVRSVPVLEHGRTVGIVSRRDLLRGLVRPDDRIRVDLLQVVEDCTGESAGWDVVVTDGEATIRRGDGAPSSSAGVEERALLELAATVGGVVSVRVLPPPARHRQRSTHSRNRSPRTARFAMNHPVGTGLPA